MYFREKWQRRVIFFSPLSPEIQAKLFTVDTHKTEVDSGYLLFRKEKGIESTQTEQNTLLIEYFCSGESHLGPSENASPFLAPHVPGRVPDAWTICGTEQT